MPTLHLTNENLTETIEKNDIVLVDFWAPWCGPCRAFGPVFEKVSDKFPDIVFGKVNTEEERALASDYRIQSIPTLMVFKQNILVYSQPGALPENALDELVTKVKELDMDNVRAEIAKDQ
jgi:thioredoxin 1